ncbi:hypothetical protein [Cellvibrio sp. OA-2007]|uniref:hypothetical protein n=1 Tax=Cellvibrio sp. OA-2007 TaxID=529823 RepID=UPI000784AB4E|nr:hypothetical protein [Cellvibrio sp. OA-2007]
MRLKEIQRTLKDIDFENVGLRYDFNNDRIINIEKFKTFLNLIEALPIYEAEIEKLHRSQIYQTGHDTLKLESSEGRNIYQTSNYLVNSASSLSIVFEKLLPPTCEESISVKLPDPGNFDDLIKNMSILQTSLSQVVVHKDIDGYVNINNWEHGSYWIELILGTQAAVAVVSSIAWAAAVICKKYNENRILEQTVRSLEIKNESLEDILLRQKELTKQLISAETNQVIDKHYSDRDPEHIKRVIPTANIGHLRN